jgi:hypothetical protein
MSSDLVKVVLFGFGDSTVETDLTSILSLETIFLCCSRENLRIGVTKKIMNSVDVHSLRSDSNIVRIGMNIYSKEAARTMFENFIKTYFMWSID